MPKQPRTLLVLVQQEGRRTKFELHLTPTAAGTVYLSRAFLLLLLLEQSMLRADGLMGIGSKGWDPGEAKKGSRTERWHHLLEQVSTSSPPQRLTLVRSAPMPSKFSLSLLSLRRMVVLTAPSSQLVAPHAIKDCYKTSSIPRKASSCTSGLIAHPGETEEVARLDGRIKQGSWVGEENNTTSK